MLRRPGNSKPVEVIRGQSSADYHWSSSFYFRDCSPHALNRLDGLADYPTLRFKCGADRLQLIVARRHNYERCLIDTPLSAGCHRIQWQHQLQKSRNNKQNLAISAFICLYLTCCSCWKTSLPWGWDVHFRTYRYNVNRPTNPNRIPLDSICASYPFFVFCRC